MNRNRDGEAAVVVAFWRRYGRGERVLTVRDHQAAHRLVQPPEVAAPGSRRTVDHRGDFFPLDIQQEATRISAGKITDIQRVAKAMRKNLAEADEVAEVNTAQ